MSELHTYNYLDIQRYLQKNMSPKEMHAFEKALMDDPFLADAFDGYLKSNSEIANNHLQFIEGELTGETRKAKVVPMPVQKTGWLKIAVVVLVVIFGASLFYNQFYKLQKENEIAKLETTDRPSMPTQPDSIGPAEKTIESLDAFSPRKKSSNNSPIIKDKPNAPTPVNSKPSVALVESEINPSEAELMTAMRVTESASRMPEKSEEIMRVSRTPAMHVFKGTILDKMGEPLPFATVKSTKNNAATIADGNGKFSLKAPDSVLMIKVYATGYDSTIAEITSRNKLNNITLSEVGLSLADMVVMGYAKRNKEKRMSDADTTPAEPVGGWQSFEQYVKRSVENYKNTNTTIATPASVVLLFSINQQGKPVNIEATGTSNSLILESAKLIILNGPAWTIKQKDKKVKVIISY